MHSPFSISLVGLLCPLLFLAFLAFVVVMIIRGIAGAGRSSPEAPPPGVVPTNVLTLPAQDGFWIEPSGVVPGSVLYFDYWSGGVRRSGQTAYQPDPSGRQFVYTGVTPEQAIITGIVLASLIDDAGLIPPVMGAGAGYGSGTFIDLQDATPSPAANSGFPSAY
jgi:hypothetical protein